MLGRALVAIGLSAFIVAACGSDDPPSQFGSPGSSADAGAASGFQPIDAGPAPPAVECKKMDIVFVIDNSTSMTEEQGALATNIPAFIQLINDYKTEAGELLDYRIGILSTDVKHDNGAFHSHRGQSPAVQSCDPGDVDKPWLERTDPDTAGAFACRAQLGTLGDNTELPLESTRLALTARLTDGTNVYQKTKDPYLRPDALLAIVVITDEDEGGGDHDKFTPPAPVDTIDHYAASFDSIKNGFRGRWATAVIAGDSQCVGPLGTADQAVRLKDFVDLASPNGVFAPICSQDFSTSLKQAFDVFSNACKGFPGVK